ncbi:MAG: dicarboxylate/amino acid:cation symporter [Rickettsiales bacterium]|nr:dicarboxylate/amino acid:cation symporter [Rickettsiales bacterium]
MAAASSEHRVFGLSLLQQVLVGLVLGVLAGIWLKEQAADLKIFGTIFINLIKMVVIPLIFLALVSGITSMQDPKNFTRVGIKGLSTYLITAMFAVIIGIIAGTVFEPGLGVEVSSANMEMPAGMADMKAPPSIGQFMLDLIPTNALRAMTEDHFLQVIVFAIFFGITMNLMGDKVEHARVVVQETASIVFKMIELIVRLAPLAVFGFMAWSVGTQGVEIIITLARLVLTVLAACIVQYLLFGLLILVFGRLSPMPFYKKMMVTQMMAFSTSSSKATLTTAMKQLQTRMGVSESSTNFLMPLGACINMDGTAIYLGICAMFFSQFYGIPLDNHQYLVLVLTSTLGSIGAAGIPSGSIIFMGMVLSSVGLPLEGIGLILGIDRMLDMVRTTINITGDAAITLIIDRSEKKLDETRYYNP